MTWLGIDIGGANLKAADGLGWAESVSFPLWKNPQGLANALEALIDRAPTARRLAVTMTGELCDCFSSKTEGVQHILTAVEQAASNREVRVYLVGGQLVSVSEARELPQLAAASNWYALAKFACRFVVGRTGLLVDVGSTTTDVIPLVDGEVAAIGHNDTERLLHQELIYRGVGRTPVCAVVGSLPWRGQDCPVAAEVFSTTADAYVLTSDMQEDVQANWTADGRPLTKECSRQRLARQVCADASDLSSDDFEKIAAAIGNAQLDGLTRSIRAVAARLAGGAAICILSGSGEFLAERAALRDFERSQIIKMAVKLGGMASQCAPAHAVAVLASEAKK